MNLRLNLFSWAVVCSAIFVLLGNANFAAAQDVVFTRSESGSEVPRKGTIVDWVSGSLTIEVNGRSRQLKNEEILRIETVWSEAYQQAETLFSERKFPSAIESYQTALRAEQRGWAQNIILARMVQCGNLLDEHALASACFAQIVKADPQTRFIHLIPLPWLSSRIEARAEENARAWLQSRTPALRLLGASWLLGGADRVEAQAALEELGLDLNPSVAHFAKLQLWKAKVLTADLKEMGRLQSQIERMPKLIQAPALWILSDVQSRLKLGDEAVLTLMRIPIIHTENLTLSVAALQKSAAHLSDSGQTAQAVRLYREIERDFGGTRFARDASAQLQLLQGKQ